MSNKIFALSIVLLTLSVLSTHGFAAQVDLDKADSNNTNPSAISTIASIVDEVEAKTSMRSDAKNPTEIPLPSALWLFGSALVGFIKISNRRHL